MSIALTAVSASVPMTTLMSHSSKPPRRGPGGRIIFIAGLALLAFVVTAVFLAGRSRAPRETAPAASESALAPVSRLDDGEFASAIDGRHAIYPYSIVAGGVHSVEELQAAMASDPVVAAHYTNVSVPETRVERVKETRQVYMSYRIGNQVVWTKHQVALRAGESILTDGRSKIRARCGNCISETPMLPTLQAEEPLPAEFDRGIVPPLASLGGSDLPDGLGMPGTPLAVLAVGGPGGGAGYTFGLGLPGSFAQLPRLAVPGGSSNPGGSPNTQTITTHSLVPPPTSFGDPPVPPPGDPEAPPSDDPPVFTTEDPPGDPPNGPPADPPGGPETPPVTPEQPVPVPEPGSMILVGTGLAGYAIRRLRKRNQQ